MTGLRFPWDTDETRSQPAPQLQPGGGKRRGRRPAPAVAAPHWLYHHLLVSGPAHLMAAFAEQASGAGVTPWQIDGAAVEEDVFNLAIAQPAARRGLTAEGCRILARQFRDRVEARQARAAACVAQSRACPFDLHGLLPVPDAILSLGPADPRALAWLGQHWGTADRLRQVCRLAAPKPGHRLPAGHAAIGYGFFTAAGQTPHAAVAQLAARLPALRFTLRPRPG